MSLLPNRKVRERIDLEEKSQQISPYEVDKRPTSPVQWNKRDAERANEISPVDGEIRRRI